MPHLRLRIVSALHLSVTRGASDAQDMKVVHHSYCVLTGEEEPSELSLLYTNKTYIFCEVQSSSLIALSKHCRHEIRVLCRCDCLFGYHCPCY